MIGNAVASIFNSIAAAAPTSVDYLVVAGGGDLPDHRHTVLHRVWFMV
jgi:hypothetical protein